MSFVKKKNWLSTTPFLNNHSKDVIRGQILELLLNTKWTIFWSNQVDYILVQPNRLYIGQTYTDQKYVLQSKTYPGADINSDNNLLFMKFRLQAKKRIKKINHIKKYDFSKLNREEIKCNYQKTVMNTLRNVHYVHSNVIPSDINGKWSLLKDAIKEAALNTV